MSVGFYFYAHQFPTMKQTLTFLVLFLSANVWSQDETRREIKGKITSSISGLDGIYVVNHQTNNFVLSKEGGYFSIKAKPGDSLMFSSIQFKGKYVTIKEADFTGDLLFVRLEPMIHELDQVVIDKYDNINAYSLGILTKPAKSYTPAERRLKTAGDLKPSDFLGLLGGSMPADPIINAISGRTARLKKELAVEKKEMLMERIRERFEERYFVEKLKIPSEYVSGFLFYIVENDRFVTNTVLNKF